MGKIVAGQYLSLDGVTESGWTGLAPSISPTDPHTGPYFNDAEVQQAVGAIMAGNDAMLLGRTTYEGLKPFFTSQSGPYFDAVNAMPKYVVSTTLESTDWANTTVLRDNLAKEIGALKDRHQHIGIGGSGTLVRYLIAENLLDELHLLVFPLILGGAGARFFTPDQMPATFTLTDCRPLDCGVVNLVYTQQEAAA
ncbi:dihydrofolate reductase family protein [Nocardia sp. CA-151230]|uniref:dihydrofolate reductase family protein n=1 Tax=Nocardia sp. CA-151230 TaxID=3239982 RepID=UPI003D8B0710